MQLTCQINNRQITQHIEPDLLLIDLIRNLGYKSVKRGCDTTHCGLCTVWVDAKPVLSCAVLAARVNNLTITTLEGLETQARSVGKFLADQGAEQCGFCSPGLIMNILAMEKEFEDPSRDEIGQYLANNLCRCSGYEGQIRAISDYFKSKKLNLKKSDVRS